MINPKYGLFLGRFSPLHSGHQHVIDQIKSDNLEPIVMIGSANKSDSKNPYHPLERINMIKLVYPDIKAYTLNDYDDWDTWFDMLIKSLTILNIEPKDCIFYLHDKEEDRQDFTFRGKTYINEFYSKLYQISGLATKQLSISDIPVRATQIRNNLETYKEFLHPNVYSYLKDRHAE